MKSSLTPIFYGLILGASASVFANPALDQLRQRYQQQGATAAETAAGRALWFADHNGRACTDCHSAKPTDVGKHIKTGKAIEPMAPSQVSHRLTDPKKIEKWLLRNCKWTLGRVCTPQEKLNILQWLIEQ